MTEKKRISGIKSWPADDRPREKLLKKGAGALGNSELLAILIRIGTPGTSAVDLARKLLKKFGTFRNMAHTDVRDWKEFKGLGGAKTALIRVRKHPTSPYVFNRADGEPIKDIRKSFFTALNKSGIKGMELSACYLP